MATLRALWHCVFMSKGRGRTDAKSRVIGSKAFAAISAVEGLKLSGDSDARLTALRSRSIGGDERRAAVWDAYRSLRASK